MTTTRTIRERLKGEDGTTLIETAVAAGILLTVLCGLLSVISFATAITENEGHLSARAAEYAQDKMEQLVALAYTDAVSDTTSIPTANAGGTGLTIGGSSNTAAPVAQYLDFLKMDGTPLCPCVGTTKPANWYYMRVWSITSPRLNLKQITVTTTVASSVGKAILPTATVTALKSSPF
jgi:hypothetical protein